VKVNELKFNRRVGKGESHPQASHRTVRETLASYGSCYFVYVQTVTFLPMIEHVSGTPLVFC